MNVRNIPPRRGLSGWIVDSGIYAIPAGLREGSAVVVVEELPNGRLAIRDLKKRVFEIDRCQIECGQEYEICSGRWVHESDEDVIIRLQYDSQELSQVHGFADLADAV